MRIPAVVLEIVAGIGLRLRRCRDGPRTNSALSASGHTPSSADMASAHVDGFRLAFAVGAGFALVGAVLALLLLRIRRKDAIAAAQQGG